VTIAERLAAALRAGELLDLLADMPAGDLVDETEMRSCIADHDVDAALLRHLLLNKDGDADPRGLRLRGDRIRGRLDLDYLTVPIGLLLEDCLLDDGLTAEQTHLQALWLRRCRVSHPDRPALDADRLHLDGPLELDGSLFTSATDQGAVQLVGARISGLLNLHGATVCNSAGPAIYAAGMQTDSDVYLTGGFTAEGNGAGGAVSLSGARIGRGLCIHGALRNTTGPALHASDMQTDSDVFLDGGFTAEGASPSGAIMLSAARIGGQLVLRGAGPHRRRRAERCSDRR
jgi:hypothetical protein